MEMQGYRDRVLCCVDKQGILSWPSSCPDKVFFFADSWRRAKPQDENLTASISLKTAPSTRCTMQRGNERYRALLAILILTPSEM
eukprot:g36767.t1